MIVRLRYVAALALTIFVGGMAACDVSLTVGYNDAKGPVSALSCAANAPLRSCADESCVVAELGPALIGKETLAVDDDSIYFVSAEDEIGRMPKAGGEITPLVTGTKNLERMVLDDEYLYWTETDGLVLKVPKKGGTPSTVTSIFGHPIPIGLHDDDLYVALTDSGEIAKIDKATGSTTTLTGEDFPIDLAVDAEYVWWVNQGAPGGATGELVRAPLGDLTKREVVESGLAEPLALGVTEDSILWATYNQVSRLPRKGGDPQTFDISLGEPKGVTELGGILYAAGQQGVFRIRLEDGAMLTLEGRGVTGISLACEGLYGVGWYEPFLFRYGP